MQKNKLIYLAAVSAATFMVFVSSSVPVSASSLLKKGMQGSEVKELQADLKKLGVFSAECTGYYGTITTASVKTLQKKHGLVADGIAGSKTIALIDRLLGESPVQKANVTAVSKSNPVLKKGMEGSLVTDLQQKLKKLGYFSANCTGYYGSITEESVKKLQRAHGLTVDGIAGNQTFSLLDRLLGGTASRGAAREEVSLMSTASSKTENYMMKWFGGVENIFKRGDVATVYDIDTGLSFKVKRTYGTNHADTETLTAEDTAIMKKIYGGQWSWARRAIIVSVHGYKFAASMAGMPHAGVESKAANIYVSDRSQGYGCGVNLDTVKGNDMSGHFDIHFYQSKTHGTQRVDENHQAAIRKAAAWAEKNY